jgi:hypothetical protein
MGKVKEMGEKPYEFPQKQMLSKDDFEYTNKFHQRVLEAADVLKKHGYEDLMGNLCFLSGIMMGLVSRAYEFPPERMEDSK